jgi:PmbA protein
MKNAKHSPRHRTDTPLAGFAYSRDFFESRVDLSLKTAKKLGASDAAAEVSESCGLSVSVRNGELENVERNRDKSLGVTVYLGQRRGNASTSDFSDAAIAQTVRAAYDIARFTAEDPFARLPEAPVRAGLRADARRLAVRGGGGRHSVPAHGGYQRGTHGY